MADTSAQTNIRGIDIQKAAVAYEKEARIFRNFVRNITTSAREIRWQQITAGILTAVATSGASAPIVNVAQGAMPNIIENSYTRNTSYVRKYFSASPYITIEDQGDNQVNLMANTTDDQVTAIEYAVDTRIWDILTESRSVVNINTGASTAAWDAASGQDPFKDIMVALEVIREQTYTKVITPQLFLSPKDYKSLMVWLVSTKGSSIPNFSSERVQDGVVVNFGGCEVVVSNNVTADYALVADANKACVWYEFTPIQAVQVEEKGVGTQIRCWMEGEAVLERPKFCYLISNTQT